MFYHLLGSNCFKYYYTYFMEVQLREYFHGLTCYNRSIQLKPTLFIFSFILAFSLTFLIL